MNRLNPWLLTTLLFCFAALAPSAALAQREVPVTNNDERGRQPYNFDVEFTNSGCLFNCSNFVVFGSVLLFDAPAVPTGKRLIVEWISAEIPSSSSLSSISFQVSPILSNQRAKWQYHGPYYTTTVDGGLRGMSSAAFFTYEPGESPHIRVKLGTASSYFAGISIGGYLIDTQ